MPLQRRLTTLALVLVGHAALAVAILVRVVTGEATLLSDGDSVDQSFCWLTKVFAAAREGTVALWDFGVMSGTSFVGELQTSPLYPPAWVAGLLFTPGDPHGVDLFLVLHFALASAGLHLLCRALGLSWASGLTGALVFAFGGGFALRVGGQPNLFAGLAWLPWIALGLQRAVVEPRRAPRRVLAAWAGVATALSLLAGHAHATILALTAAVVLLPAALGPARARRPGMRRTALVARSLEALVVTGLVSAALALPQLVATDEYLRLSFKWYGDGFTTYPHVIPMRVFVAASLSVDDLGTIVSGGEVTALDGGSLFLTLTGLACAAVAAPGAVLVPRTRGLTLSACALALVALSFGFARVPLFAELYHHLPPLSLVRTPARGLFMWGAAGALLAAAGAETLGELARRLAARVAPGRQVLAARLVPLALALLCLAEARAWLVPRVERELDAPDAQLGRILHGPVVELLRHAAGELPRVYRASGDREFLPPNIGDVGPLLSAQGCRSTRTIAYHSHFDWDPHSTRLDAFGVRWWVSGEAVPGLPVLATLDHVVVQERPTALPVFSLVGPEGLVAAPIEAIDWRQNEVRVRFAAPVEGTLVFAQAEYPGFRATAGGAPIDVGERDHMMALELTAPAREVVVRYAPWWWLPTVSVSLLTLAAVLAATFRTWRRAG